MALINNSQQLTSPLGFKNLFNIKLTICRWNVLEFLDILHRDIQILVILWQINFRKDQSTVSMSILDLKINPFLFWQFIHRLQSRNMRTNTTWLVALTLLVEYVVTQGKWHIYLILSLFRMLFFIYECPGSFSHRPGKPLVKK